MSLDRTAALENLNLFAEHSAIAEELMGKQQDRRARMEMAEASAAVLAAQAYAMLAVATELEALRRLLGECMALDTGGLGTRRYLRVDAGRT